MNESPIVVVSHQTLRRLKRPRRWIWGVGLVVLGAMGGWAMLRRSDAAGFVVRRGDLVHAYVANGRVEAEQTIEIVSKVTARIESVQVREGDEVREGQLLVTLESADLRALRDEAQRVHDAAQARFDEVARGTRQELLDESQACIEETEHARREAEARLADLTRAARTEDIAEAEAQVAHAQVEVECAAKDLARIQTLFEQQIVAGHELDEARRRYETARAVLSQRIAARERVVHGATREERTRAAEVVERESARLEQARAVHARLVRGATDEERRVVEAELKRAAASLLRFEFELNQTHLTAPIAGVVARRYKEPSELAYPSMTQPILVIASMTRLVRAEISETDLFKVRVGQQVVITSEGHPGRQWKGGISRVAPTMGKKLLSSDNPKEKADVKILEIWIASDSISDVPLNLPVEVRVDETVRQSALMVPARCVDSAGRVRMSDGSIRTVQTGARDGAFVEIRSGLGEGESIFVPES